MENKIKKVDDATYKTNLMKIEDMKKNTKGNLISFYINIFIKYTGVYDFKDLEFLHKSMLTFNEYYKVKENSEGKLFITYNSLEIDNNEINFIYARFMKFHVGFLQFMDWFNKYNFKDLELHESVVNDYAFKQFYVCLENSRRQLGNVRITELSDLQLISKVCIKERLTLYNYLRRNSKNSKDEIKTYINGEYLRIIKEKKDKSQLTRDLKVLKLDNYIEFYKI